MRYDFYTLKLVVGSAISGKSTMLLRELCERLKRGEKVLYVDTEHNSRMFVKKYIYSVTGKIADNTNYENDSEIAEEINRLNGADNDASLSFRHLTSGFDFEVLDKIIDDSIDVVFVDCLPCNRINASEYIRKLTCFPHKYRLDMICAVPGNVGTKLTVEEYDVIPR